MIKVESDTMRQLIKPMADFTEEVRSSRNFDDFTFECGLELKSAILGLIVAAQDEYIRIMRIGLQDQMDDDDEGELREMLLRQIADISPDGIAEFRQLTGM